MGEIRDDNRRLDAEAFPGSTQLGMDSLILIPSHYMVLVDVRRLIAITL